MDTLSRPAPRVNPTARDLAVADRLAFLADGGDPDAYRPSWRVDDLDPVTGKTYRLHPIDAGYYPERDILDTEAASFAAFLADEAAAEVAHLDALAFDAGCLGGYMAGLAD